MNQYLSLELMGLVLCQPLDQRPTQEQNPMLYKVLDSLDMRDLLTEGKERLLERYQSSVQHLKDRINYFRSLEMKGTEPLNVYLSELYADYHNGSRDATKTISIAVCGFGNKPGPQDKDDAIVTWINEADKLVDRLANLEELKVTGSQGVVGDMGYYSFTISSLIYIEKILEILDVFTTCYRGMILGAEEYAPVDENYLRPIDPPDFVTGTCSGDSDCQCGCQLDHPVLMLEGLEDLLGGRHTYASRYMVGVASAHSDGFVLVTGNEGEVFDKIKDLGKKALDAIMDSFEAIKDKFNPEDENEFADNVAEIAENNKKALQNIKNKGLKINDAAKEGIVQLAKSTDETGEMSKAVSNLSTVDTASGVIDVLLGLLQKEVSSSSAISKAMKDTQKSIDNLKKVANQQPKGSEDNKEDVSLAREGSKLKIKEAKDSLKELRKELGTYRAKMSGIKKAISGISPHIFPDPDKEKKSD